MRQDESPSYLDWGEWYLAGPFRLVYAALGLSALSLVAMTLPGTFGTFSCILLMLAGLLAAGGAVWWRMSGRPEDNFEERSKTGILVSLASGAALSAYLVMNQNDWDSLRLLMMVAWVVTLCSVMVLLLPKFGRRVVVSLLLVYHFGAIMTAVTAVQASNGASPWLPTVIWNNVYRKYVLFTYLNNAYHFYSPEPGPPSLLWFRVEFEGGRSHWIRLVQREDFATRQQYQRMLSLTESINQVVQVNPWRLEELRKKRSAAGIATPFRDKDGNRVMVPMVEGVPVEMQYREPPPLAKKYLLSYASYVLRTTQHPDDPDLKPIGVKIYRLTHRLILPDQLESGLSPTDPTLFWVFFDGEYKLKPDGDAELSYVPLGDKDLPLLEWTEVNPDGTARPRSEKSQDPFLYWQLPIYYKPKPGKEFSKKIEDYELVDTLSIHSGSEIQWKK
jgi:hypothetical protein